MLRKFVSCGLESATFFSKCEKYEAVSVYLTITYSASTPAPKAERAILAKAPIVKYLRFNELWQTLLKPVEI